MTERKQVYWPDNWVELVYTEGGRPVRYCSVARRTQADEPWLATRIAALTGYTVRFGEWKQFEPVGRDLESASEVELTAVGEPAEKYP